MMGKTRIEELCYELYGSSKQHDSWQRYAMVRELRELMKRPKASGSDHFERSGEDRRFGGDDRRFGGGQFREGADDDDETDLLWKKENPEDQALNDEELVETEVETKASGIEDRSVENEANSKVISAIDKEEPISQLQVPASKLEPSLRFHNASPDVCEDFKSLVGLFDHVKARDVLLKKSAGVTNNQAAHYLFDKMSLRVQSKRRQVKCHKSWRFKFKERKQRRGKLRSAHKLIHRVDVMEDDHVYQEGLPLWLLVRFRFWKFKFINRKLQKVMREQGFANHLKLMYDKGEHDELFIMARTVNVRCLLGIMFGIIQSNAGYGQKPVYNQIIMVNERMFKYKKGNKKLHNKGLFIRLLNKLKQQRCPKSWMFKFKTDSKSARTNHILLQEKKPNKFEQVMNHTPFSVAKFGKYKDCDALLLLRPSNERFQIKHRELLVIVLEWVDTKGGFGMDKKPLHLSLRNRVWDPGGCLENLEVKVSSKEGDLI